MPDTGGFSAPVAQRIAGASYRQLDYWDKHGLVKPSVRGASGKGSRRVYSFEDLVELRVVTGLRARGASLQAVRRAVSHLRQSHVELTRPLANLFFITDGKKIFTLTDDPGRLIDLTSAGQVVFAVSVAPIIRELRERVSTLASVREIFVSVRGAKYRVILTPDLEVGGFTIEVPEVEGCISEADSLAEARSAAREAIELCLEATAEPKSFIA